MLVLFLSLCFALAEEAADPCKQGAEAYQRGDYAQAEILLNQCLDRHPDDLTAHLRLCAFYQSQGKDDKLVEIARKALGRFPKEKRFYMTVGVGAGRRKAWGEAIETFSEGLRRWPDDPKFRTTLVEAYLLRGMEYLDQGENSSAEADLNKAQELDRDNAEVLLNLGRALHNLEHSGRALKLFDQVLELEPGTPLIQFHRGVALNGLGQFYDVISAMNTQLLVTPAKAECYYFRGLAFQRKGEWDKARADLTVAVEGMPDFGEAVYRLARCYQHFGQLDLAEAAFERSLSLNPTDVRSMYGLGRVLQQLGKIEQAKEMFQKAETHYTENELEDSGEKSPSPCR